MGQLEDMRAFVRVVESGSISRAAERLGVAKSAVSRRLADLEERLGAQLFRRTTRRLNLTNTGRVFHERCARILADVEEAEQAVSQEHAALQGTLRVAAPLSFGLLHLTPAITEFMTLHPHVEFDLDFNDRQVDLLQEGFDVAIRIAELPESTLIARRLATVQHVVCASPEYLARYGAPQRPQELSGHTCMVYSKRERAAFQLYSDMAAKVPESHLKQVLIGLAKEESKHKLFFESEQFVGHNT